MPASLVGRIVATAGVLAFIWLILLAKRAYASLRSGIPGPWHANFTDAVLRFRTITGSRMYYIHSLHERYGAIVRISPGEIDISDPQAFREIHRIGAGYLKSSWYSQFRKGDSPDIFSMINPKDHAQRRKLLAPMFSNTSLRENWTGAVIDKINLTVANMRREAAEMGEADVYKWWTFMAADVTAELSFGESFGMLEKREIVPAMKKIEEAAKFGFMSSELPLLTRFLRMLPFAAIQNLVDADDKVQEYGEQTMARTKRTVGRKNLFSRLVEQNEKSSEALSDYQLAFEAGGFVVAGSGTTAVTLTYLVWAVLSHPEMQKRLEEEVAGLPDGYTDADVERLPYVSAVIEETLRLYSAAPGSLPRVVPSGGATLCGYFLPAGAVVNTQAYSIHRVESVYPEPETYKPERFLSESGEFVPGQQAFAPFGAGSRICLGLHLARMELRLGVARFFRECRGARLAPSTTPKSMEPFNFFLIVPSAEKCNVVIPQ